MTDSATDMLLEVDSAASERVPREVKRDVGAGFCIIIIWVCLLSFRGVSSESAKEGT